VLAAWESPAGGRDSSLGFGVGHRELSMTGRLCVVSRSPSGRG
jgi:hypothetical protein